MKFITSIIIFSIFIIHFIINMVELFKYKNNLTYKDLYKYLKLPIIIVGLIALGFFTYFLYHYIIVSSNRIKVTESNSYSYSDFEKELVDRGFIYEIPDGKKELAGSKNIIALDSKSENGYEFTDVPQRPGSSFLSVNTKRKFPMFVYEEYTSLIKKSDRTKEYYYIGPNDWYITWYIYYVNGEIYAAIGEEAEYNGQGWKTSLSTTEYGVVVTEKDEITIYNAERNYLVKGGGILDTSSKMQRTSLPTTTDIYNEKCMKIKTVDKVNAETLDKIAKELSPQYWKVYKSYN